MCSALVEPLGALPGRSAQVRGDGTQELRSDSKHGPSSSFLAKLLSIFLCRSQKPAFSLHTFAGSSQPREPVDNGGF